MNFLLLLLLCAPAAFAAAPQTPNATVIVPVADVWSRPLAPGEKPSDALRETQVLKGEGVIVYESSGPWARIEALEQPTFREHNKWEGYPGWVLESALRKLSSPSASKAVHSDILTFAASNTGTPYLWGGMSKAGFDCSGLVHLAYRRYGMVIPRNAYEQWMKAKPIARSALQPGDLIFSSKEDKPKLITHVAIYAGDGMIIEAPQMGVAVRKISFKEKYGKDLPEVESGDHVMDRYVYFGTFLH